MSVGAGSVNMHELLLMKLEFYYNCYILSIAYDFNLTRN